MVSFALQQSFFMRFHLLSVDLSVLTTGLFRKLSHVPVFSRLYPTVLFYGIHCIWTYAEVFDPLGLECCTG